MRACFLVHWLPSFCCNLTWGKERGSFGGGWRASVRALIPFMRAPPSWSNHFPKATPSNTIALRVRKEFTVWIWGWGGPKHSDHNKTTKHLVESMELGVGWGGWRTGAMHFQFFPESHRFLKWWYDFTLLLSSKNSSRVCTLAHSWCLQLRSFATARTMTTNDLKLIQLKS